MIDLINKKIGKVDIKIFEDIIEDGQKPRSIIEIKKKYNLTFPFQVKRVVEGNSRFAPGSDKTGFMLTVEGFTKEMTPGKNPFVGVAKTSYIDIYGKNCVLNADYPAWVYYG